MLRKLKLTAVSGASRMGLTKLIGASSWRRNRLLILCYHGVSLGDEHLWAPALFVEQSFFRRRMEMLRRLRANVLPLGEAVERLYRGDLPERSVAVTVDDGWHGFHRLGVPVLKELAIPTTLYLTTYYSNFNRPVFDTLMSYMLWKTKGRPFSLPEIVSEPVLDARKASGAIVDYVRREQLTGQQKDGLLQTLAAHLGFDYEDILREKFMHLMTPADVRQAAADGVDIQLHTHRHRVSKRQELFHREIEDNRAQILSMTGVAPTHFCYPGGNYLPEFEGWLSALGVSSATTCDTGLCTRQSNRYFLPRLLDSATIEEAEFEAWVTGMGDLLPKRQYAPAEGQFLEDWDIT